MTLSREEKERLVANIDFWYHTIDLGDGVVTPGWEVIRELNRLTLDFLPRSFAGRSVLDVGCWDGLFSFTAERRGAASVLGIDNLGGGDGFKQEDIPDVKGQGFTPFLTAHRVFDSRVEHRTFDLYDLTPSDPGTFDVTFFFGVLYHLWHPLLALQKLRSVTRRALFIETHYNAAIDPGEPLIRFYPSGEKYEASTWVGPNLLGLHALLRTAGFADVRLYSFRDVPERSLGVAFVDGAAAEDPELVLPPLDERYVPFDPEHPGCAPTHTGCPAAAERDRALRRLWEVESELASLLSSRSWRMTAPLRGAIAALRRVLGG